MFADLYILPDLQSKHVKSIYSIYIMQHILSHTHQSKSNGKVFKNHLIK